MYQLYMTDLKKIPSQYIDTYLLSASFHFVGKTFLFQLIHMQNMTCFHIQEFGRYIHIFIKNE